MRRENGADTGVAGAQDSQGCGGTQRPAGADMLRTTRATVGKWSYRFLEDGCDGLLWMSCCILLYSGDG